MADMATPSAVAMTTADVKGDSTKDVAKDNGVQKPEKPDEELFKKELAAAEKDLQQCNDRMKSIKSKLDRAKPQTQDSPTSQRRNELITERNAIRQTQQTGKSSRGQIIDKIKRLDEQLKAAITEDKDARSKVKFRSADDVQAEIDRLQRQVDSGTMKIVDEKKALGEVTNLNRLRKGFATFDQAQDRISSLKSQIADLRKPLDNPDPEQKAMSDRFAAINAELDTIKAEQDDVYKNLNGMRDERTKVHEQQQAAWAKVKDIKDRHFGAKRAYGEYEKEAYRIRREKQKTEREAYEKGKKKQYAQSKLEDASAPAYQSEITAAEGLVRYFDPSAETKAPVEQSKFAAQATRTVSDVPKGTALAKKSNDDDDFFIGGGGKKKKGRKVHEATTTNGATEKFNLSIGVIEQFAQVGLEPPMSQGQVPSTVEQLKSKIETWKSDQDRKTKENIAKAQKEIDALEG